MWSNQRALVGGLTITKNSWNIELFILFVSENGLKLDPRNRRNRRWSWENDDALDFGPNFWGSPQPSHKNHPPPKTNTLCLSVWNPSQDDVLTQASWPTAKKQWCCRRMVSMGTSMKQWTNSNHPLPNISPHIATWKFHYFSATMNRFDPIHSNTKPDF